MPTEFRKTIASRKTPHAGTRAASGTSPFRARTSVYTMPTYTCASKATTTACPRRPRRPAARAPDGQTSASKGAPDAWPTAPTFSPTSGTCSVINCAVGICALAIHPHRVLSLLALTAEVRTTALLVRNARTAPRQAAHPVNTDRSPNTESACGGSKAQRERGHTTNVSVQDLRPRTHLLAVAPNKPLLDSCASSIALNDERCNITRTRKRSRRRTTQYRRNKWGKRAVASCFRV